MVLKTIEVLGRERILGVVFNATQEAPAAGYGTYYHAYEAEPADASVARPDRL